MAAQLDSALAVEGNVYAVKADIAEILDSARYNAGRKTWVNLWNGSQGQIYRLSEKNDRSLGKMLPFVRKAEYKLEQEGKDDYLWTNIFI